MSVASTTAVLRPGDQAFLDEQFTWEAVVDGGMICVTIKDYPLADGLAPATNELLVRLPAGFPDVGPDMFWFAARVERVDGAPIPATDVIENYLGRSWQRWSRHIGSRWRPGSDDLRTYMAYIATCIRSAAQ
jgi:hypothetical protein